MHQSSNVNTILRALSDTNTRANSIAHFFLKRGFRHVRFIQHIIIKLFPSRYLFPSRSILEGGFVAAAKFLMPRLKNAVAVISSAGVGAIFGFSLDPLPAIAFMVGLSFYDIWAVYGTRHMITMARELGGH